MSGQNGYGNGYGYSGTGRYDANDGAQSGSNSNSSLGVSGYGGRSAGASSAGGRSDRRPGGYGGFYEETPQQRNLSPGQSPAPSQSQSPERRRDRLDRDQQPHSQYSSRSRSRNQEPGRKRQEERFGSSSRHSDNRTQDRNASHLAKRSITAGETQAVESWSSFLNSYFSSVANQCALGSDHALDPTRLEFYDRC